MLVVINFMSLSINIIYLQTLTVIILKISGMLKSLIRIGAVAVIMATVFSCNKPEQEFAPAKLGVDPESVEISSEGGSAVISILSNRDWTASWTSTAEEQDWLTLSAEKGAASEDSVSITVTALPNNGEDRFATVSITTGTLTEEVSVRQPGKIAKEYTSISDVRALYEGENVTVTEDWTICGTVISNYRHETAGGLNNATSQKTVIVQDETAGISLYLEENNESYAVGDLVEIRVKDLVLQRYQNGSLQLDAVPLDRLTKLTSGPQVEPKEITAADLCSGEYESQYVAVSNVQVADSDLGKTFVSGDSHTSINFVSKEGDRFVLFSSKYSTFGGETVPEGSGTLKGIAAVYGGNTYQISITSTDDYAGLTGERFEVESGNVEGKLTGNYQTWNALGSLASFFDDFESITAGYEEYVNDNWLFWTSDGSDITTGFKTEIFENDGSKYVSIAPFNSVASEVVAYALPPRADMTKANPKEFSFRKAYYYRDGDDGSRLEVVVSTDFAGDFENATWTVVKDATFESGAAVNQWVTETVDLSGYSSEASLCIAIRYTGHGNTYRIDNVGYGNENQGEDPGEPEHPVPVKATVAEVLAAAVDDNVWYELTGTITNVTNTTYGNFTLVDETGEIDVYGLTSEWQIENDKSFSELGLKEGDIVTLAGTRDEYNGEPQVGGPAYYISHVPGEDPGEDPSVVKGTAGDGVYTGNIDLTQPSANSSDEKWSASIFKIDETEYDAMKLGTSSVEGSYSFNLGKEGSATLTLYAIAWNNKKTNALVKISGGGTINGLSEVELDCQTNTGLTGNSPFTITFGSNDFYTLNIEGATSGTVITVTTVGMDEPRIAFAGVNVK